MCNCISSEKESENIKYENNNSDSNNDIEIAFDYLIAKVCKYMNMNLNDA